MHPSGGKYSKIEISSIYKIQKIPQMPLSCTMCPCYAKKPQYSTLLPQLASKTELKCNKMVREGCFTSLYKIGLATEGYFTSLLISRVYLVKTLKNPKYHDVSS
jgi:hypothetical protein